jgi:hypothetical protein
VTLAAFVIYSFGRRVRRTVSKSKESNEAASGPKWIKFGSSKSQDQKSALFFTPCSLDDSQLMALTRPFDFLTLNRRFTGTQLSATKYHLVGIEAELIRRESDSDMVYPDESASQLQIIVVS